MKKNIYLVLSLCFCALLIFLLIPDSSEQVRDQIKPTDRKKSPTNKNSSAEIDSEKASPVRKPTLEEELMRATFSTVAWSNQDLQWVKKHDAGITFSPWSLLEATLKKGDREVMLGEDPPKYLVQMATTGDDLLISRRSERHHITRILSYIDEGLRREQCLQLRIPKAGGFPAQYGFVFDRNEASISRIGVIIPSIEVPADGNPYDYQVHLRYGDLPHASYSAKEAAELGEVKLDKSKVVILGREKPTTDRVRVLWLKVKKEGGFELIE